MTDQQTLEQAIDRVQTASKQFAALPLPARAGVLRAIADAMDAAADQLIATAAAETNLTEVRLRGELKRTTFQLRLFAQVVEDGSFLGVRIDHADPDWPMGAPRPDLRRVLLPIGPVLVFSASNFPFAFSVAGGDVAAALAAGNAVLVKAHSGHPRLSDETAAVIAEALRSTEAPDHLIQVIHGTQNGVAALQHPGIRAGAFTGSIGAGRALFDVAASRPEPIPFYGELGSVNPAFVLPGASADRAAEIATGYLGSITGSQGQLCTKPGLFLVPEGSPVIDALRDADAPGPAPLLNARIQAGYGGELAKLAGHDGVQVLRGETDVEGEAPAVTVLFTTAEQVLADPEALVTEVFGPTGLVATYSDPSVLARIASGLQGQLTATVVGDEADAGDLALARELFEVLAQRAGRLLWNQWPTGLSVTHAQQHGGPYPSSTAAGTTSVGTAAIERFLRPVVYQNLPQVLQPEFVQDANPLGVPQDVDRFG